jgi:hypothetical protein
MDEKKQLPAPPTADELTEAGVQFRHGSDPLTRGNDPLERYRTVPNHAMFLYTSEDQVLDTYVRKHWAALDGMSGDCCDIEISLVQLLGGADAISQFDEVKSLPGLAQVNLGDLPALHIWSIGASVTISLRRFNQQSELRDVFRSIFSVLNATNAPINDVAIIELRDAVESVVPSTNRALNGQSVTNSIAGGHIIQISVFNQDNLARPGGESMSEKKSKITQQKGQTIEDVKAGGKITQRTDERTDSQAVRRAEAGGNVEQKKAKPSTLSFGWGNATGFGVLGLVVTFIAWLIYKYLIAT